MWININKQDSIPITKQIYMDIKKMILDGSLQVNEKLPSTRALAKDLHVSRNTILEAYNQLIAEGFIEGRHGSGTVVASGIQTSNHNFLHSRPTLLKPKPLDNQLIDFRSGIPDLSYFPRKEWARLYQHFCYHLPHTAMGYYHAEGVTDLRNAISQYLYRVRGIRCEACNIMIVSGATQGLSLVARLLCNKEHKKVIVEDPTHHGLLRVMTDAGLEYISVPADEKGLDTTQLNNIQLQQNNQISFLYTTPSHQYPLGGILPIQRRQELIQYADQNNCYIVEDDYDSEFRYEGQPVSSLYELNPERVIYIGSFSKILAPAIRLGFIILPEELTLRYKALKQYSDVHTEALVQHVLGEFIQSGGLENHIRKMKKVYTQKREHLIKELIQNLGEDFQVKGHAGGLHIVVAFKNIIITNELIQEMYKQHVKLYPIEDFCVQQKGQHKNEILLGYAHLSKEQISKGVTMLSNFLKEYPYHKP